MGGDNKNKSDDCFERTGFHSRSELFQRTIRAVFEMHLNGYMIAVPQLALCVFLSWVFPLYDVPTFSNISYNFDDPGNQNARRVAMVIPALMASLALCSSAVLWAAIFGSKIAGWIFPKWFAVLFPTVLVYYIGMDVIDYFVFHLAISDALPSYSNIPVFIAYPIVVYFITKAVNRRVKIPLLERRTTRSFFLFFVTVVIYFWIMPRIWFFSGVTDVQRALIRILVHPMLIEGTIFVLRTYIRGTHWNRVTEIEEEQIGEFKAIGDQLSDADVNEILERRPSSAGSSVSDAAASMGHQDTRVLLKKKNSNNKNNKNKNNNHMVSVGEANTVLTFDLTQNTTDNDDIKGKIPQATPSNGLASTGSIAFHMTESRTSLASENEENLGSQASHPSGKSATSIVLPPRPPTPSPYLPSSPSATFLTSVASGSGVNAAQSGKLTRHHGVSFSGREFEMQHRNKLVQRKDKSTGQDKYFIEVDTYDVSTTTSYLMIPMMLIASNYGRFLIAASSSYTIALVVSLIVGALEVGLRLSAGKRDYLIYWLLRGKEKARLHFNNLEANQLRAQLIGLDNTIEVSAILTSCTMQYLFRLSNNGQTVSSGRFVANIFTQLSIEFLVAVFVIFLEQYYSRVKSLQAWKARHRGDHYSYLRWMIAIQFIMYYYFLMSMVYPGVGFDSFRPKS